MMDDEPIWLRVVFSLVPLVMGLVILGAWYGIIPTDGGEFHAPPVVILSLAAGLILFAALLWVPASAARAAKVAISVVLLLFVAVVCNWTAFAPGISYISETSLGPFSWTGEDPIGGRVVFGLAALAVDALIAMALIGALWNRLRRK